MPTYDYLCDNDGQIEIKQSIESEAPKSCPVCGEPIKRIWHAVPAAFKGTGFYTTDKANGTKANAGNSKPLVSGRKTNLPAAT